MGYLNFNQTLIQDKKDIIPLRDYTSIELFAGAGGMGSQYQQIGNAVPVNLAYHLGKSIIQYLNLLEG